MPFQVSQYISLSLDHLALARGWEDPFHGAGVKAELETARDL